VVFVDDNLNGAIDGTDGNNVQDIGEAGIEGVEVLITVGGRTTTVITDAAGRYSLPVFTGFPATVDINDATLPGGFTHSDPSDDPMGGEILPNVLPADSGTSIFDIALQDPVDTDDLDGYRPISVESAIFDGVVFNDANNDGIYNFGADGIAGTLDAGEEVGIPNVEVALTDGFGGIQTLTTDAKGLYSAVVPIPAGAATGGILVEVDQSTIPVDFTYSVGPQSDPTLVTIPVNDPSEPADLLPGLDDTDGYFPPTTRPPEVAKLFTPSTIPSGGISNLSITLTNPTGLPAILTADMVDTLPAGVTVAATPNLTTSCGPVVALAGTSTVTLNMTTGIIPIIGCTITVDVTSSTIGMVTNTIAVDDLQTNRGNNATPASAPLTVTNQPRVTIDKALTAVNGGVVTNPVLLGNVLTYTVTATNTGGSQASPVVIEDILLNVDLVELSCMVIDNGSLGDTGIPIDNSNNGFVGSAPNSVFLSSLGAGDSVACNYQYTVATVDTLSCTIDNTAQVSGGNFATDTDMEMVAVEPAKPEAMDDSMMFTDQTVWQVNILTNDSTRNAVSPVSPINPNVMVDIDIVTAGVQNTFVDALGTVPGVWTYTPATGILDFNPDTDPVPGTPSTLLPDDLTYRLIETIPGPTACASPQEDTAIVDFTITTTPVTMTYFQAEGGLNGQVDFTWKTELEIGTVGFNIYVRNADEWVLVNDQLIQSDGIDTFDGADYSYTAHNISGEWFAVAEVSATEELAVHGPYYLNREYGETSQEIIGMDWERVRGAFESRGTDEDVGSSVEDRLRQLLEADERAERQ
jgi:hypothetical protein